MLAFTVSRPALDSLADRALANPSGAVGLVPTKAGVYGVESIEVRGQEVIFYTRVVNSYVRSGFARAPGRRHDFEWLNEPGTDPLLEMLRLKGDWFVFFVPGPS